MGAYANLLDTGSKGVECNIYKFHGKKHGSQYIKLSPRTETKLKTV